ncbi:MAG: aldose epimerase family protein [Bryobacteraceae bacterium]
MIAHKLSLSVIIPAILTISCAGNRNAEPNPKTGNKVSWGKTPAGEEVDLYTLTNSKGAEARISTYGGVLVSLKVPDRSGAMGDIVLGFDNFDGYLIPPPYFGALIGRYGNRIANAQFTLDGAIYKLAKNDGPNSLHGGLRGFDKRLWTARSADAHAIELNYLSKDGEEGFPGNLNSTVKYTLTDNNEIQLDYSATTDKDTVLNLTNHSYFNLAGQGEGEILGHRLTINADTFTPVDKTLIPTGEMRKVEGTPFDFRQPHAIGERIGAKDEQLVFGKGYDHNFVLNRSGTGLEPAAKITDPKSGRVMEVLTTQPGLQFYTGNFLDGTIKGKGGKVYGFRTAFCMETQHFPDSPNHPAFPTTELKPGEQYKQQTVYRFSTDGAR